MRPMLATVADSVPTGPAWVHEVTGNDAILNPIFAGGSAHRLPFREALDLWIAALTGRYHREEFVIEAQRRGLPASFHFPPTSRAVRCE